MDNIQIILKKLNPSDTLNPTEWERLFRWRSTYTISRCDGTKTTIDKVYYKGKDILVEEPKRPRVLILGPQDASQSGLQHTIEILKALSENPEKPIIISGLTNCVNWFAHTYALEYSLPTVAVLPSGLDEIPTENKSLAKHILDSGNGCLLSTFPTGTAADATTIRSRNTTMSILSDLIIVVESHERDESVTVVTENGGPALAVPGNVDDMRYKGNNWLIRKGYASILDDFSLLSDQKYFFNPLREKTCKW